MTPDLCKHLLALKFEFLQGISIDSCLKQYSTLKQFKNIVKLVLTAINQITDDDFKMLVKPYALTVQRPQSANATKKKSKPIKVD